MQVNRVFGSDPVELVKKLRQRDEENNPICVGIIGCGQMGSGLAHAISNVTGMTVKAIADIDLNRAINAFLETKKDRGDILVAENVKQAQDALDSGKVVVAADAGLLTRLDGIEANVEATGVPEVGSFVAWSSIRNNKPVIMLNVETDVTVGADLNHLARKAG